MTPCELVTAGFVAAEGSDQGRVAGVDDRVEQAGEALVHVVLAESHVPPERAGAAAGILTTAQQFGVASGVALIGAVFYARLGITRASSVSAMELALAIDAVILVGTAGLTLLLPRRADQRVERRAPAAPGQASREPAEYSAGPAR